MDNAMVVCVATMPVDWDDTGAMLSQDPRGPAAYQAALQAWLDVNYPGCTIEDNRIIGPEPYERIPGTAQHDDLYVEWSALPDLCERVSSHLAREED